MKVVVGLGIGVAILALAGLLSWYVTWAQNYGFNRDWSLARTITLCMWPVAVLVLACGVLAGVTVL